MSRTLASASVPSSGLCAVRILARDATVLYGRSTLAAPPRGHVSG
ncbi:MAG: hypothetical protein AVDCRST_MAG25-709 [uncultured Rubrobacteraceae bacterium]|uniref:Uncharacterized protein n=1 Tax=uncultured Rubrobacteraceae bacterium TaxID=349277 RepID=A0A6J4R1I7_9ACTN|nr:MAG: hypothetical protein AVDCRST_MAG25-709 [uncultured Rubrobacteraceae bacterium]